MASKKKPVKPVAKSKVKPAPAKKRAPKLTDEDGVDGPFEKAMDAAPAPKKLSKEEALMAKLAKTPKEKVEPENPFRKVVDEVRNSVAASASMEAAIAVESGVPVPEPAPAAKPKRPMSPPRQPDDPALDLPEGIEVGQWMTNHEKKRVVGRIVNAFPKQRALTIENYLGVRQVMQWSFLRKCGYQPVLDSEIEALKAQGYTNTFDVKRQWTEPRPAPVTAMSEETKAKLREVNAKKAAERAALRADQPARAPRAPKVKKACLCGCGGDTMGTFQPGHDVKFKKKIVAKEPTLTAAQIEYALQAAYFPQDLKNELKKRMSEQQG